MSHHNFVISHQRPWWKEIASALILIGLLAATGFLLHYLEVQSSEEALAEIGLERDALSAEIAEINEKNATLAAEITELKGLIAILERAGQVEKQAYDAVEASLTELQEERLELKEELAFYRGIATKKNAAKGLGIGGIRLQEQESGWYRISIALTRIGNGKDEAQGTVDLTISGTRGGIQKELSLQDLLAGEKKVLKFRLKHFQRLNGHINLPEGFVPDQISVRLTTSGKKKVSIEKSYDWSSLIG